MYTLQLFKEMLPLVIWTEPTLYDHSSVITVNGYVNPLNIRPVSITVINPLGSVISIEQVTPDASGDFTVKFNTGGKL